MSTASVSAFYDVGDVLYQVSRKFPYTGGIGNGELGQLWGWKFVPVLWQFSEDSMALRASILVDEYLWRELVPASKLSWQLVIVS